VPTRPEPQSQPHGGSLRAKGAADEPPTPLPARAPSVRNIAGGFRPTAITTAITTAISRMAAACGRRGLQTNGQRLASARTFGAKHRRGLPPNRYYNRCYNRNQPHGGSLRAKGPANERPVPLPARAPSVRNIAGGFRPAAITTAISRMAAACGLTGLQTNGQRPCQRAHLRCETSPGASAQPLLQPQSAAWRQPAGEGACKRLASALASARTFGAKHRRGLPPNRCYNRYQPHGGSLRAKGPANERPTPCERAHLRCETSPGASALPLLQPQSAAWRQPAGEGRCRRLASALASARTFGAKHRRGLPPNRCYNRNQPHGGSLRAKGPANERPTPCQRAHLRCETSPGASAQPLSRLSAAWRQPAGKRPCHRPANALDSARTFGAKHSRGLPPDR